MRPDPCIQTIPLRPEEIEVVREDDVATRQVDRDELARRLGSPGELPPSPPPIPQATMAQRRSSQAMTMVAPPIPHATTMLAPTVSQAPMVQMSSRREVLRRSRKVVVAAVLVTIALVAVATVVLARTSDDPRPPVAAEPRPSVPPTPVVAADPVADLVERAHDLIANGDRETALDLVLRSRATYVQDARLAALAGRLYFEKLWWADGVEQLRAAFALEPSLRSDPELVALAVKGYVTTPAYNALLGKFVREDIGAAALPALEQIAKTHRSRAIRSRAAAEIRRMSAH